MEQPPPLLMVSCARCALFIESRACDFTSEGDPVCARCAALIDLEATQARARAETSDDFTAGDAAEAVHVSLGVIAGVASLLD